MKRRVLVAQALVHKPPVIVLDEPTAGVDVELRQGLWRFVRRMNRDGHSIVLTTHYLEEAEAHCSRIAMLKEGRIAALDTTRNLLGSFSGVELRLHLEQDVLPTGLPGTVLEADGAQFRLRLASYRDLMSRFLTLCHKELLRFFKVSIQTIAAPVLTTLLYLVIFGHALEGRLEVYEGVRYTAFLVPGLVMMSVLQNAFANSSSSLIQSKITGNIVFVLIAPISYAEFFAAYVVAAVVRGLVVGLCVLAVTVWFVELRVQAPLWVLAFALLGAALLGTLGLVAGVVSDKIDQVSAFQNFVVLPLTFLSGVFYSIHSLPPVWQQLSHANPFFYLVDGFRYGFFGASDFPPLASLAIVFAFLLAVSSVTLGLLKSGYKLRY
jgi:ABC-2 type transport system permease protein